MRLAARLRPNNPFVQELLGVSLLKVGEYTAAVAPLEAAVRLRGDDFTYMSNLAFAYERVERYADALRVLHEAKALNPAAAQVVDAAIDRVRRAAGQTADARDAEP